MVDYNLCKSEEFLEILGRGLVPFSPAGKGTKVNIHTLHALLGLIVQQLGDYGYFSELEHLCSQGNIFSDSKSHIPEVDITPIQQEVMTREWSNAVVVDNTALSLPSNPAFNSFLASLFPQLTNAYLVTHVVRYRPGESHSPYNLVFIV